MLWHFQTILYCILIKLYNRLTSLKDSSIEHNVLYWINFRKGCSSRFFSLLLSPLWFSAPWIPATLTSLNSQLYLIPLTQVCLGSAFLCWGLKFQTVSCDNCRSDLLCFSSLKHHYTVLHVFQCVRRQNTSHFFFLRQMCKINPGYYVMSRSESRLDIFYSSN